MIHCKEILFKYPNSEFKLEIPQLRIESTDRIAIVGPSGSGKTTLINLLSGILNPMKGDIFINNINLTEYNKSDLQDIRIVQMGLIFQEFRLIEYLNVFENIIVPFRINSILKLTNEVRQRASELAKMVGLEDKLLKFPSKLSQGERQRVAICRALIGQPKVLLCDEPTANLDPTNRDNILSILKNYSLNKKIPLVVITHDESILPNFNRVLNIEEFK